MRHCEGGDVASCRGCGVCGVKHRRRGLQHGGGVVQPEDAAGRGVVACAGEAQPHLAPSGVSGAAAWRGEAVVCGADCCLAAAIVLAGVACTASTGVGCDVLQASGVPNDGVGRRHLAAHNGGWAAPESTTTRRNGDVRRYGDAAATAAGIGVGDLVGAGVGAVTRGGSSGVAATMFRSFLRRHASPGDALPLQNTNGPAARDELALGTCCSPKAGAEKRTPAGWINIWPS